MFNNSESISDRVSKNTRCYRFAVGAIAKYGEILMGEIDKSTAQS